MSAEWAIVLAVLALPVAWVVVVAARQVVKRRRERREEPGNPPCSAAAIIARVQAERVEDEARHRKWPVAGYVPGIYRARDEPLLIPNDRDDRPTEVLPVVSRMRPPPGRKPKPYPE